MAIITSVDQDTALTLQQSVYHVKYTPSTKRCTVLFQKFECIQYQMKITHHDPSVEQLTQLNDLIMHYSMKTLWKAGYDKHNIDQMETTWKEDNKSYAYKNTQSECRDTKYSRYK